MSTVEDKNKFMEMLDAAFCSAEEAYGIKMEDEYKSGIIAYFNYARPWETINRLFMWC